MLASDVAPEMQLSLANVFTNGSLLPIKRHKDTVLVTGHVVDLNSLGPVGVSHFLDPLGQNPLSDFQNGLPGDFFGGRNNIRHSRTNGLPASDPQQTPSLTPQTDPEGVYLDDIIIGFAARGEMVGGSPDGPGWG